MINATINNIVLEGDRFRVFVTFTNGKEEINAFLPDVTAQQITDWVNERLEFYNGLQGKESELKEELLNLEIKYPELVVEEVIKKK